MTRTAIYSLQDNALTKETGEKVCCHESARSLWKDGDRLEENKDYQILKGSLYAPSDIIAFPLPVKGMTTNDWMKVSDEPVKSEDDLWREAMEEISDKFLVINGDESHLKDIAAVDFLKQKYIITKR